MVLLSKHDGEPLPEAHEVLFRSAVVLMVSHWEAYIEDICSEALDHLIQYTTDPAKLPKEIKKQVADEIKSSTKGDRGLGASRRGLEGLHTQSNGWLQAGA